MTTFVLSLRIFLGFIFLGKRDLVRLVWVFYWEETKKSVGNISFVSFLDNLEGEK